MKKIAVIAFVGLFVSASAGAAGDAAAGKTKSATCTACHMADGNSVNPIWPKLAGQHPRYLTKQIMDFKEGRRKDATMTAMAAPLSAQDAQDLAAYFSGQTTAAGAARADLVEAGQRVYRGGNPASGVTACMACHGAAGKGMPEASFPQIGGQHPEYTVKQLKDFRAGNRENDPNGMMREVAGRMTDAEIEAVAHYLSGLH